MKNFTKFLILSLVFLFTSIHLKAQLFCSQDTFDLSVNPWDCSASLLFTNDLCSISGNLDQVTLFPNSFTTSDLYQVFDVEVTAVIDGITYTDQISVRPIDDTSPVVVAKLNIVIALSESPQNPGVFNAKLFAESVDNGSYDACGPVKIAIRRTSGNNCGNEGILDHNNNTSYYNFDNLDQSLQPNNHNFYDTDNGNFVEFCCSDLNQFDQSNNDLFGEHQIFLGVWDDGNQDGIPGNSGDNFNETFTTVRVVLKDNLLTGSLVCPDDIAVDCTVDIVNSTTIDTLLGWGNIDGCITMNYTDSYAYDENNDGDFNDTFLYNGKEVSETYLQACNQGVVVRTWTKPGSSETCDQLIYVLKNDEYFDGNTDIDWPYSLNYFVEIENNDGALNCTEVNDYTAIDPNDIDLQFSGGVPTGSTFTVECLDNFCANPIWLNTGCELVGYSVDSDIFNISNSGECKKIVSVYTVVDWCTYDPGNSNEGIWTWTVVGKQQDLSSPILTAQDISFNNCIGSTFSLSAEASDPSQGGNPAGSSCVSNYLNWEVELDLNSDNNIDLIWSSFTVEDGLNNLWDDDDNDGIPEVQVGNVGNVDSATSPFVNQGSYAINIPSFVNVDPNVVHTITWKVSDPCGNLSTTTSTFEIDPSGIVDNHEPTPYCISISTAVTTNNEVELYAIDFNAGSFDNCSASEDLRFTFSNIPPQNDPDFDSNYRTSNIIINYNETDNGYIEKNIYVWDEADNYDFCTVGITLTSSSPCSGSDIDNFTWPSSVIDVFANGISVGNGSIILSPDNLISEYGYSEDEVSVIINPNCSNTYAWTYDDHVFDIIGSNSYIKIIRTWSVINWLTNDVLTFVQVIQVHSDNSYICDFLPNSAPFGDCDSGHTDEDDVEWPDDIEISEHRITPQDLVSFSGIPESDSKPIFNDPSAYLSSYVDLLESLSPDTLILRRVWSVERIGLSGISWSYEQLLTVDLNGLTNIVSVHTPVNRPFPNIYINNETTTNTNGVAIISPGDQIDPFYLDNVYNGVTIKDIFLLRNHILGFNTLTSEAQLKVADLNKDQIISTLDVIELDNIILGVTTDMASEEIWTFENITNQSPSWAQPAASYLALKTGDIDDDAEISEPIIYPTENVIIEDLLINDGELYETSITVENAIELLGSELHLNYDSTAMEIILVSSDFFPNLQLNISEENIHILGVSANNMEIKEGDTLIKILFKAKNNTILNKILQIDEDRKSFFLDLNSDLLQLNLEVDGEIISNTFESELDRVRLFPNPVIDFLHFDVPKSLSASDVKLKVYNVTGKEIFESNTTESLNLNFIESGIYLYRLEFNRQVHSGKFIKI